MPIVIPKEIPAYKTLSQEKVFVMTKGRAQKQDIRPIEIAIVNLMPTKIATETQLMRLLSNSPLQINITLLHMQTYESKNISKEHLDRFYTSLAEIKNKKFDGMIITGAPLEYLSYKDVKYWAELVDIMNYSQERVTSTIFICWGAQAALNHFYNINKVMLEEKQFGIYENKKISKNELLLKGLDDNFKIPLSRHSTIEESEIEKVDRLKKLARCDKGLTILKSKDNKEFYLLGHSEYDRDTLKLEYERDLSLGKTIKKPENYFVDKNCKKVDFSWHSTANILISNWVNHYVYQATPYDIEKI